MVIMTGGHVHEIPTLNASHRYNFLTETVQNDIQNPELTKFAGY